MSKVKIEIEVDHKVVEMVNYVLFLAGPLKGVDAEKVDVFRQKMVHSLLNQKGVKYEKKNNCQE